MGPKSGGWTSARLCRSLAGLEVGIWAGLGMLTWIAIGSTLSNHSVWIIPNLLSALFTSRPVVRYGFSAATLPGLALHMFTSGVVGILFGLVVGEARRPLRVRLLGLTVGLIWYYFSNDLFWKRLGPVGAIYASPGMMLTGHLVFGTVLGWYPSSLDSVRRHMLEKVLEVAAPPAASVEP